MLKSMIWCGVKPLCCWYPAYSEPSSSHQLTMQEPADHEDLVVSFSSALRGVEELREDVGNPGMGEPLKSSIHSLVYFGGT